MVSVPEYWIADWPAMCPGHQPWGFNSSAAALGEEAEGTEEEEE